MINTFKLNSSPFFLSEKKIEWIKETFESMDLKEKIGQLFVINTNGSKKDVLDVLSYNPGGVFLHMHMKGHQYRASKLLQEKSKIPLLNAGDLEFGGFGGAINGTPFCTQMGIAATNDENIAYKFGTVVTKEGNAMGFNTVYAPVVDINYNWKNPLVHLRSFGDQPEKIIRMTLSYLKALKENGMIATAKHFPGDGMDDRNQHFVTTHNSLSMEEWRKTYGKVYKSIINSDILSIMSAHIDLAAYNRELNPNIKNSEIFPASISPVLNNKLLREELGFNGLIVSDATGMLGLTTLGQRKELVPKIISDGCDMFLFAHGRSGDFKRMYDGYETGIISENRLNEAVLRILASKAAINLDQKQKIGTLVPPKSSLKIVGCKEHNQWARECSEKSITLVKDLQNLIPISPDKYRNILLIRNKNFKFITWKFKHYLAKKGFKIKNYRKGMNIDTKEFDLIIYLVTILGLFSDNNIQLNWKELGGMHWFAEKIPTMFISLGNPYHLYDIPRIKTYINTYSPFPFTQEILVDILVGEKKFSGINPIDPFCGLFDAKL